MITRRSRNSEGCRGLAAVELAVCLPLILTMLVGLWEVGRVVEVQQILNNAAREGARQSSTGQLTNAQVQQVVLNYMKIAGLATTNATVTATNLNAPASDVSAATSLDPLQVVVTIPFRDVRLVSLNLVLSPSSILSGRAVWLSLKDVDYPSSTPQPPQG
jgi:Flp pilus assembly protein TadG